MAHCWSEPPPTILWQRDKGAFADVITHLDNLAQCLPMRKAWDELVCLPPSAASCSLHPSGHGLHTGMGGGVGVSVALHMVLCQPGEWRLCVHCQGVAL